MSRPEEAGLTGLVLAGGESRRLAVDHKALAPLAGQPLLKHVLARFEAQVDRVLLSVHETSKELAGFGHEQVVDVVVRQRGPLTGLVSGLLRMECRGYGEWLLICPCDAPFLPRDLATRLAEAVQSGGQSVAVARYEGVLQPVFSLWNLEALPGLKDALLERGQGGLMRLLKAIPHATADWPSQMPSPFFNVNTAEELDSAQRLVDGPGLGE